MALTAQDIIKRLTLEPHPEGGWYRRTWPDGPPGRARPKETAIYYLLEAGQVSRWHRIDGTEIWHHYAGAPIALRLSPDGLAVASHVLGPDIAHGHRPQVVVPAKAWQTARTLGGWALVGCTVTPGFTWETFELAPPHWEPGP